MITNATSLLVALFSMLSPAQEPAKTLEEKIAVVLPKSSEEAWLQIPWRSDFAAARTEANQLGKPLFVWMMNGNPLGCT